MVARVVLAVSAVHLNELGLALGILGAVLFAGGALAAIRGRRGSSDRIRRTEKRLYLIGGLLLAIAFVVQLVAIQVATSNSKNASTAARSHSAAATR